MTRKKQAKRPPKDKQVKIGSAVIKSERPQVKAPATPAPIDSPKGVGVASWNGKKLFQCDACPYNSLDIALVIEHVAARHGPTYVDTGLVGPTGGSIIKEV